VAEGARFLWFSWKIGKHFPFKNGAISFHRRGAEVGEGRREEFKIKVNLQFWLLVSGFF
jgi:hypothetical protein